MTDHTRPLPPVSRPPTPEDPAIEGPPQRRWLRRGLVIFLVVANVAIFGGLAAVWFAARQVTSSVSTIPTEGLALAGEPTSVRAPRTILVIGSDSRAALPADFTGFGQVGGERADVIMLIQILPSDDRIQVLSIPRDLRVVHDGAATKINGTFAEGPEAIVGAVAEATRLPIHHYIEVDFAGFAGIIDAIGGIEMTFPYAAKDQKSKFAVDAGTQRLGGKAALAYARSRSYQELRDGTWVSVDANDIGRTQRQQDVLMAVLTQIDRPSSVDGFGELLDALGAFVAIDEGFDEDDIIQLGWQMRSIGADGIETVTLPVEGLTEGGVSYVVASEAATDVLDRLASGDVLTELAATNARITVQNGNGRPGAAGLVADALTQRGFTVASVGNTDRNDHATTLVIARPVDLAAAREVVDALGYGRPETGSIPAGTDLMVIVGLDAPTG